MESNNLFYKKVFISKPADLPKECDRYFTHNIADFMSDEYFNPIDNHTLNDRYKGYDSSIHYWLHNIDWYLLSCDDYVQALEELVEARKEYSELLGSIINGWAGFMHVHGVHDSEENINKGKELRQRIETLTKKIKG
jgi:hypothetical protein